MKKKLTKEQEERLGALMVALQDAAVAWWAMKRPLKMSREQHTMNATINCCTPAEEKLALACSEYIKVMYLD